MSDPNEVIEQQLRAERPWAAVKLAQARIAELEQLNENQAFMIAEHQKEIPERERELAKARKLAQAYYARGELDMGSQAWNLAKAVGWKPVREILDEQGGRGDE